ncbi:MAG TPA: sensor histidine kinase, partial [Bacteroidota bacterium]|nr:sensor histidine kinase [Bacteroidota bacterium]
EKEILVKEVLHRVKNNLNLVASLLNLQAGYVVAPEDAVLFREARDRIIALARIHENLYGSRNLAHVDFRAYVADIIRNLSEAYRNGRVRTRMEMATIDIGVDRAIPLGLIINELVTNSLKYAFPEGREGEIVVCFRSGEECGDHLSVRDNGIGLPETLDVGKPRTFGLSLVNMLADQIGGKLEVKRGSGTEILVHYPR